MTYEISQIILTLDHCLSLLDMDHSDDIKRATCLNRLKTALKSFRYSLDIAEPETVQVRIDSNGKTLWVNTEHGCVARLYRIGQLEILDDRPGL